MIRDSILSFPVLYSAYCTCNQRRTESLFSTDSLSETLTSFSYLRKISSCLFICATFFPGTLGSKPGIQILIAGNTHTRTTVGITTAFTFLFLLGHHSLGQIVAVLHTQNAANLSVLPEEAHAAGLWLFSIVSDSVDQNGVASRFFSHHNILQGF